MNYDVIVVGGSVAGSMTARALGLRGLRVVLLEKAKFPRFKPCGEGLLPHGVAALREMGLEFPGVPVRGIRYVSPSGCGAAADFPAGEGRVVRRDRFDSFLFQAAAATPNVDALEATSYDPGRWKARWIVAADGLRSQFHRRPPFSARPPKRTRVGLSTHVKGLRIDRERVEVLLHAGGEIYLAPSDDGAALVACLYSKEALPSGATNDERVAKTLSENLPDRIDRLEFTTPCLAVAPLGLSVSPVVSENVLLVGDAAGAPDPVTGEGMSLAILSARAAAEAIVTNRPIEYERRRRRLAAGSEWLGRWVLRAARGADRVVPLLAERPELFRRLLEIAVGTREPGLVTMALGR